MRANYMDVEHIIKPIVTFYLFISLNYLITRSVIEIIWRPIGL